MDKLTPAQRSENMSRIRGRDTNPELIVRRLLHSLGYRYRTHVRNLPGRPDIVFGSRRAVIFVHGCFWHRHGCGLAYSPKTRPIFWEKKFQGNIARDKIAQGELRTEGWRVKVIWECELKNSARLSKVLIKFLSLPTHTDGRKAKEKSRV